MDETKRLGEAFEAHRVVRDIFVQICQDKEKFEHAIALLGIRHIGAFLEIFYDCKRVRKEPLKIAGFHRDAAAAAIERLVRARERFIEEMAQAELFGGESAGYRVGTPGSAAISGRSGCHDPPHGPEVTFPELIGLERNTKSQAQGVMQSKIHWGFRLVRRRPI